VKALNLKKLKMKHTIFLKIFIIIFSVSNAQTQLEMNQEAHKNFLAAEKELNVIYNKILKEYKSDTMFIKNLKKAQKIWLQLREAEMNAKYPDPNPQNYGSVWPMCFSMYKEEFTKQRTKVLKVWLDGIEEGDVCSGSVKIKDQ